MIAHRRTFGVVTVGPRGEFVMPSDLREALGVEAQDQLLIVEGDQPGSFVAFPAERADGAAAVEPSRRAPPEEPVADELATYGLLEDVPPAVLRKLAHIAALERYAAGAVIEYEAEPCRAAYIVRTGLVRRFKTSVDGKEQITQLCGPGESFNDIAVFDGGPNFVTSAAASGTELYALPRDALASLIEEEPELAIVLARGLARRLRGYASLVESLSFLRVPARVALFLLSATTEGHPTLDINQHELAAMVGSVRDVAGRALRALQADGAIAITRGSITVLERERLTALLE